MRGREPRFYTVRPRIGVPSAYGANTDAGLYISLHNLAPQCERPSRGYQLPRDLLSTLLNEDKSSSITYHKQLVEYQSLFSARYFSKVTEAICPVLLRKEAIICLEALLLRATLTEYDNLRKSLFSQIPGLQSVLQSHILLRDWLIQPSYFPHSSMERKQLQEN
ncbi:hypothetical protein EVAR_90436_1 [Eumeta japonica]|uniref:Uncharacterized protein n=1 Tax=Eumeta variegata TaxID=151549 RepID=A0A4C1YCF5_EUMVA|nr:hypothetical protein EVAR_90436_1 [Eumeta japonica]